jgi:hypothetical protein
VRSSLIFVLCVTAASFGACGDDESGGNGGSGGSTADASSDAGGSAGSGGSGGTGGSGGSAGSAGSGGIGASCGSCGNARAKVACNGPVAACLKDPGCKAIRDCVYGSAVGCALGENGAKCAEQCVATYCTTSLSGKLFLEAEHCIYCEGACTSLCQTYCGAFTITPDSVICTNPIDAGAEASDADTDAATDATSEALPNDAASDSSTD